MWPEADFDRIRASIEDARAHGIRSEVDGVSPAALPPGKKRHAHVYDLATSTKTIDPTMAKSLGYNQEDSTAKDSPPIRDITMPVPILLYTPTLPDGQQAFPRSGLQVDLVVDSAGKVNSAKIVSKDNNGMIADSLIGASGNWKFIPAMKNGRAVASRILLTVSPFQ